MTDWKNEMLENNKIAMLERTKANENLLKIPNLLSKEEKRVYQEVVNVVKESVNYKLTSTDIELIWQYCQIKIMRDKAWKAYSSNPERYVRIVTGLSSDGKTPKIIVKENEYYKTLVDCNKQLEKILKDLRLTPNERRKKRF